MAPVKSIIAASMLLAAQLVSGHSVITNAVGDAGGSGSALGVVSSTPRDGTRRNPFQQDATRFRGASAKTFGETVGQGANDVESGTSKIMAESGDSLPQVTAGGQVTMTLHQVNGDGAGPYTCMINADGTGGNWDNIQVTQNVDGRRGRNNAGSKTDHPLVASIPANQQCSGDVAGQSNVCLVRCQNQAGAGPFGGVVPVQMASAANNNGAANNNNGAAANNNGAANNNNGAANNNNGAANNNNNGAANNNNNNGAANGAANGAGNNGAAGNAGNAQTQNGNTRGNGRNGRNGQNNQNNNN